VGSTTQTVTDLLPSTVLDGSQHVLDRVTNTWSHLSAGSAWLDYSASADLKPASASSGYVGVAARYQDANNYVSCGIQSGGVLQLWDVVGGKATLLASKPLSVASGVFHKVRLDAQSNQLSCAMDGTMLLHGTDLSVKGGRIGLIALGDVTSEFANVLATGLP
jgi:hypothetical protein